MGQDDRPILVLDSGVGGLTVLREVRFKLPFERLVYVLDDAGFPYGAWEEGPLTDRLIALVGRQIDAHDPKAVLIACNTAFTLAGEALRKAFPGRVFVGTVPAIKPAAERTRSGLVSVLATPGTVRRAYTRDLIANFAKHCHVRLVGSDRLAEMTEAHLRGEAVPDEDLRAETEACFLEEKDGRRTDIVVLACTHYPFLTNRFREVAPWPVDWLDPAEAIARQLSRVVTQRNPGPSAYPDIAVFTTGQAEPAAVRLMAGFGLKVPA
ncbi:glutamate racemase [Roseibium litorale]|uniref:Glutamate racemase n=1 Tax=Roseibium litorale TaxID=2803841 RepID=A0ABR9CHP6_9HYPH|nr:glutamate racemase [Roseibium litorale]MBD8890363.1 glutamate racemase [Roseibium litorale]